MPVYDFMCHKCGKVFEFLLSNLSDSRTLDCPDCGSQQLKRLICIVDFNRLGVTEVLDNDEELFQDRVKSCGWHCSIIDGHNFEDIEWVLRARRLQIKPLMIIAKTIKGKGISFMENGIKWHHSVPSEEEYLVAKKELEE